MRRRITKREERIAGEEKVASEVILAEKLVKLAKALMADDAGDDDATTDDEPKFNELKMSIKGKLNKFNKKGLLKKKLQSIKGLSIENQMVSRMTLMQLFELLDEALSL